MHTVVHDGLVCNSKYKLYIFLLQNKWTPRGICEDSWHLETRGGVYIMLQLIYSHYTQLLCVLTPFLHVPTWNQHKKCYISFTLGGAKMTKYDMDVFLLFSATQVDV